MKKIAAIFLLIVTMTMLAGCGREEVPFTAGAYGSDGAEITEFVVDVRDRKVEVSLSGDESVHMDYFESEKEFYTISLENVVLTMTAASDKAWEDYVGGSAAAEQRTIRIRLPQNRLSKVSISTTNEDISLPALTVADSITLSANGGDIRFDTLDVGSSLNLNVKNGDIAGRVLGGYDDFAMTCTTKKGACNLPETKAGGDKGLNVTANNGDVNIEFTK